MAIRYKENILGALKEKGYTTTRLRNEKVFGQKTIQDIRSSAEIPYQTLNKLCEMLDCQIGDIIEYVPDKENPPHEGEE